MSKKQREPSIRLSPKHGVNPSLAVCFFCGEDTGEIMLPGMIGGYDKEAPHRAVWHKEPCPKCKEWMTKGVILISYKDEDQGKDNPCRTGGWAVVTDEAISRMVSDPKALAVILKKRVAFVPDKVWDALGLPHEKKV